MVLGSFVWLLGFFDMSDRFRSAGCRPRGRGRCQVDVTILIPSMYEEFSFETFDPGFGVGRSVFYDGVAVRDLSV